MTSLQGSIKDFGVADILQLLSQQQKTGILLVEHDKESAEIYFSNGELIDVKSPHDTERLGAMFVKSALVSEEQYKSALEKQKNTFENICSILLRQGFIKKEDADHIVLTNMYEVFYEILQWRKGAYRFVAQNVSRDASQAVLPGLESILLDVLRMIDEWPDIKGVISSFDLLFAKNNVPVEGLEADEMHIYELVDGSRSVQEIIDAGILGCFYSCKILVMLLERGYIRLLSKKAEAKDESTKIFMEKAMSACALAAFIAVIILLLALPGSFLQNTFPVMNRDLIRHSMLGSTLVRADAAKIEKALEIYRLLNGNYPGSLRELRESAVLANDDFGLFDIHALVYARTGAGYELTIQQ